ncbi:hypothetical protein HDK77DRAFT_15270 [Phyllosticta capitalensis]
MSAMVVSWQSPQLPESRSHGQLALPTSNMEQNGDASCWQGETRQDEMTAGETTWPDRGRAGRDPNRERDSKWPTPTHRPRHCLHPCQLPQQSCPMKRILGYQKKKCPLLADEKRRQTLHRRAAFSTRRNLRESRCKNKRSSYDPFRVKGKCMHSNSTREKRSPVHCSKAKPCTSSPRASCHQGAHGAKERIEPASPLFACRPTLLGVPGPLWVCLPAHRYLAKRSFFFLALTTFSEVAGSTSPLAILTMLATLWHHRCVLVFEALTAGSLLSTDSGGHL